MEKLNLTKEEARRLTYDDLPGYETVENKLTGESRWSKHYRLVVQRTSDGKFFAGDYSRGATEEQDERPFEYSEPEFKEVKKKEKIIFVYE